MRSYGDSGDPYDSASNTLITQAGGTNYPMMIADIDLPGPASLRYIHWIGTGDFKVAEILCWEKRRLYDTEIQESYNFFLPVNSPIRVDTTNCDYKDSDFDITYTSSRNIYR